MDHRTKIRLMLGLLAGLAIIALIFPWGSGHTTRPPPRFGEPPPYMIPPPMESPGYSSDRLAEPESPEMLPPAPAPPLDDAALDRLRAQRDAAQSVIDRAARGEPVPADDVAKARTAVQDLIQRISEAEAR